MLGRPGSSALRHFLRLRNSLHEGSLACSSQAPHDCQCHCPMCTASESRLQIRSFSSGGAPPRADLPVASTSTSTSIQQEVEKVLRKLPKIRPPTQDAAGSEQLPMAAARPPPTPLSDSIVRRLLGERGVAIQRHLDAEASPGKFGSVFSNTLRKIRQKGLNIDESWDGLLAKWDKLLDERQYDTVLKEMQERGGTENEFLTTLYRDIARRQEADQRAVRHAEVEAKRAQVAASRVVKLDEQGRAYGTGKRKTSIARVWIRPVPEGRELDGKIRINGRPFDDYIRPWSYREELIKPFEVTNTLGVFDVVANVHGGGVSGQASAIRHGISKALQCFNPELRQYLRPEGLLTRDARVVERKKPGKAKARKSFQWVKR